MPRGAAPKPASDKRGTSHRPPKKNVAIVAQNAPTVVERFAPPEDLSIAAADVWRMAVSQMDATGTLREFGTVHLRFFCDQFVTYLEAQEHVKQYGNIVQSERGPITNPELRTRDNAMDKMLKLSDRLGLDPLSMLKLGIIQATGQSILSNLDQRYPVQVKV